MKLSLGHGIGFYSSVRKRVCGFNEKNRLHTLFKFLFKMEMTDIIVWIKIG